MFVFLRDKVSCQPPVMILGSTECFGNMQEGGFVLNVDTNLFETLTGRDGGDTEVVLD